MLIKPTGTIKKDIQKHKAYHHRYQQHQYGELQLESSLLLDLPVESLTHITSFLDPKSLLALSKTSSHLYELVKDDNTWFRAFLSQFLGIDPECDLHNVKILLLRKLENTWRKEMINRYKLKRRWERSRTCTITHTPLDSTISSIHLMPENGLLSASIQYGVVSRSLPFTGKVLKGYIGASQAGLGIGNPNVEFTPNISSCAITSDGGTARVFWGYRNGDVVVTTASKALDSTRAAAKLSRSRVIDEHEDAIQDIVADPATSTFLTAGADGRTKLWDTMTVRCLWASDQKEDALLPDPFVKVAGYISQGIVVGALKSGDLILWTGLKGYQDASSIPRIPSREIRIPNPVVHQRQSPDTPYRVDVNTILLDEGVASSSISVLVVYADHPYFYRLSVDTTSDDIKVTRFGDLSFGFMTAVKPVFATSNATESNFVIVGDQLGCISIYDWNHAPVCDLVGPVKKFEAHDDGAVTSVAWTPVVFATGSSRGTVKVWDSLTLELLHVFSSARPAPGRDLEGVSQIILERELIMICVGSKVTAWKLGSALDGGAGKQMKSKRSSKRGATYKGQQQFELHKEIAESREELEVEQAHTRRANGREREQRLTMDNLGLSETEALEYILMLSRDEEENRRKNQLDVEGTFAEDDSVFEADFDSIAVGSSTQPYDSTSPDPLTPLSSRRSSLSSANHCSRSYPRAAIPISNEKVQVSPRFRPEPVEAGFSTSPLSPSLAGHLSSRSSPITTRTPSLSEHFPPISSSLSSTASTPGGRISAYQLGLGSPVFSRRPLSTSQASPTSSASSSSSSRSAWSKPPAIHASTFTPSASPDLTGQPSDDRRSPDAEPIPEDDMDDDLRLAIQLSLAEAGSQGEA